MGVDFGSHKTLLPVKTGELAKLCFVICFAREKALPEMTLSKKLCNLTLNY